LSQCRWLLYSAATWFRENEGIKMLEQYWGEVKKLFVYAQYCAGNDMQTIICRDFWQWAAYILAVLGLLAIVLVARALMRGRQERHAAAYDESVSASDLQSSEVAAINAPLGPEMEQSQEELSARIREALKTRAETAPSPRPRPAERPAPSDTAPQRELMAIMLTDMVGYSGSMERNERAAYARLIEHNNIIRTSIAHHRGREIKTIGDAFLVLFRSVIDAVDCALSIQCAFKDRNLNRDENDKILIRIGVHLGDVLVTSNDVYGDGVNVASRIEPLAEPGGICLSGEAFAIVRKKLEFGVEQLAGVSLKNITDVPDVYRIQIH